VFSVDEVQWEKFISLSIYNPCEGGASNRDYPFWLFWQSKYQLPTVSLPG